MKQKKQKKKKKKIVSKKRVSKRKITGYYIPGDGTIQTLYEPKW